VLPMSNAGANGYVAGELVHQLLQKGYDVHGTVRDPGNPAKTAHLYALAAALPGTLQLHSADLLEEGSFDDVIRWITAAAWPARVVFWSSLSAANSLCVQIHAC
jgi:uncharacterized protein YbjT (DUF2867 family)